MAKFANRQEQRHVTETMTDLLLGLKKYANDDLTHCINKTIEVLQDTEYHGENTCVKGCTKPCTRSCPVFKNGEV